MLRGRERARVATLGRRAECDGSVDGMLVAWRGVLGADTNARGKVGWVSTEDAKPTIGPEGLGAAQSLGQRAAEGDDGPRERRDKVGDAGLGRSEGRWVSRGLST